MTQTNSISGDRNDTADAHQHRLVLVTGPSGAGRFTAVKCLEDIGFEAIDNLPLSLLPRLFDGPPLGRPIALGVDVRNRDFSVAALLETLEHLTARADLRVELLYLDCAPDVLIRRFSETRRPHPLSPDETPQRGVGREIELLMPVRAGASVLIDTTELTPHDLRAEIGHLFDERADTNMALSVQSFSYKRGVPRSVDMVFDVRFLRNPHWDATLRPLAGLDARVADYVAQDPRFDAFFDRMAEMVELLLPAFQEEGKSHLSIGFGCTGGKHRSIAVAERLAKRLADAHWRVSIRHREQERLASTDAARGVAQANGGQT